MNGLASRLAPPVMVGRVPTIHGLAAAQEGVDGRDMPDHDECEGCVR
jgi:hypothetical protein